MSRPTKRRAVIILAGMAMGAQACSGKDIVTENPPEPNQEPEVLQPPPMNPPGPPGAEGPAGDDAKAAALPTWDEVESGHPKGATNPPMPVLFVAEDGSRCWKGWSDPRRMKPELMRHGGIVVSDEAETDGAIEVACPEKASGVLESHAAKVPEPAEAAE